MASNLTNYSYTNRGSSTLYNASYRPPQDLPFKSLLSNTAVRPSNESLNTIARFPAGSFHTCRYPTAPEEQRKETENNWHSSFISVETPIEKLFQGEALDFPLPATRAYQPRHWEEEKKNPGKGPAGNYLYSTVNYSKKQDDSTLLSGIPFVRGSGKFMKGVELSASLLPVEERKNDRQWKKPGKPNEKQSSSTNTQFASTNNKFEQTEIYRPSHH